MTLDTDTAWLIVALFCLCPLPMFICAVMGRARGYRWYLVALLGLLSIIGMLIALLMPPVEKTSCVQPELQKQATRVRLTWRNAGSPDNTVGEIETEVARIADRTGAAPPTLAEASEALRLKAASIGANAVARVEYFRIPSKFWTFNPRHVLRIRGIALKLSDEQLLQVPSDAEETQQAAEMQDPRELLSQLVTTAGTASIVFACLNAGAVCFFTKIGAGEIIFYSAGAYIIDVALLVFGLLILRTRMRRMIQIAGITLITLGTLTLIMSSLVFGVILVLGGIGILQSSRTVAIRAAEYDRIRASTEKRMREQTQNGDETSLPTAEPERSS